jgi:hypothetical protein
LADRQFLALSEPGLNFLKCAFAQPDFATTETLGIPDDYTGKTLLKDDVSVTSVNPNAGFTTYYLFAPTPGVAYWSTQTDIGAAMPGSQAWTPTYFPDYDSFFPDPGDQGEATNVTAFRYAGLAGELVPTSSPYTTSGDIRVQKVPIRLTPYNTAEGTKPAAGWTVSGGTSVAKFVGPSFAVMPANQGAYAVTTVAEPEFEFHDLLLNYDRMPASGASAEDTIFEGRFVGMYDMDSIVMAVTVPAGAVTSFAARSWHCVEYKVRQGSMLYSAARTSPPKDPVALQCYRTLSTRLPVAVPYRQNGKMWETVKGILRSVAGVAAMAPNPVVKTIGTVGGVALDVADLFAGGNK